MDSRLTHLDDEGAARIVDVGGKPRSARHAEAEAVLAMSPKSAAAIVAGDAPKGDVIGTARLAGITAAKRTAELIPLAHQISLSFIDVRASVDVDAGTLTLTAQASATDVTGVEMEAMTACAVAALTVYDMSKALERGIEIRSIRLLSKRGGRSDWRRGEDQQGEAAAAPPSPGSRAAPLQPTALPPPAPTAALLTISTSRAAGSGQEDLSGQELRSIAQRLQLEVAVQELLADSFQEIQQRLRQLVDIDRCALILTSGGTGFAPSDITPEATASVLERQAPGLAEAIRAASREHTPHWALSRGVAGVRGRSLIVNLPGSPAAVRQAADAIVAALPHALKLLAGADLHPH
jgi:cyclic pyranopterin phosphate synthase